MTRPIPTCPVCVTREQIDRYKGHWMCSNCWTLFTAGQGEWEQTRQMRELYEAQQRQKQYAE